MPSVTYEEPARLEALKKLRLEKAPPESFDRLTELAANLFDVSLALVSLVGKDELWFKSMSGSMNLLPPSRKDSLCVQALESMEPLVSENLAEDIRYRDNPLVHKDTALRFYAAWPLRPDGVHCVGTFCLVDTEPRQFCKKDRQILETLGRQVEELMRLHTARQEQEENHEQALISTARYGALIGGAAVGILRVNGEGEIQDVNPFALELLGYDLMALKGEPLTSLIPENCLSDGPDKIPEGLETLAYHRDGHGIPVQLALSESSLAGDHGREFIAIITDLSAVRAAQMASQEERALLESIISASRNPIYARDRSGVYLLANEATRRLIPEMNHRSIEGARASDLFPKSFSEQVDAVGQRVMQSGNPETLEFVSSDNRHFNITKSPLYDARGTIQGTVSVAHDITELTQAKEALEERHQMLATARDQAERANRAKTDFLSAMSHELRTPLNSILGFSQLLENNPGNPLNDKQRRQVGQIRRSGEHLLELINEILDLARIESGRISLSLESIDSGQVVQQALETVSTLASQQSITLSLAQPPQEWPVLMADQTRLKQVLLNLLSNAIKYNQVQGQVTLSCVVGKDHGVIHCQDTGIGINDEQMSHLFEPFNRLGADDGIEGTGIGLALTRRLVQAMHGELSVFSREGVGSDFQVHLPLAPEQPQAVAARQPATETGHPKGISPKNRTILYVEDNPANQDLLSEAFEGRPGEQLLCIHSAEMGIDLARSSDPALILMDINLPGMDGYKALKLLRQDNMTRNIPVIAISANAMPEDIRRGKSAGFNDYLTKPVDIPRLFEIIDQHIHLSTKA
ncbi:MAG: ATP-binding protein [Oleiphilaceae bacterium]|nr:ATP-binding protein [Oleiphilaceae bacterium]